MAGRLGNVIYWTACGIAGLSLLPAAVIAIDPGRDSAFWITLYIVAAVVIWLVGRAARYVLSEK